LADKTSGVRRPTRAIRIENDAHRRKFAAAMARAELGRFYWSASQELALREAIRRRLKPKP
jgi:hypothetical protein